MVIYEKQKAREEKRMKELAEFKEAEKLKQFLEVSGPTPQLKSSYKSDDLLESAKSDYKPGALSDFWAPGMAAKHDGNDKMTEADKPDTVVRCPMSREPIKFKDLVPVNFCRFEDESVVSPAKGTGSTKKAFYCCAVSKDVITDATPCVVLKTSGSIVTEEVVNTLIKKDMIDPINGKKMTEKDFIPLYRGSLGFTDERIILTAKRT